MRPCCGGCPVTPTPASANTANRPLFGLWGVCVLALAGYVAYEAAARLLMHTSASRSLSGIGLAAVSLVVMPLLSRALICQRFYWAACCSMPCAECGGLIRRAVDDADHR